MKGQFVERTKIRFIANVVFWDLKMKDVVENTFSIKQISTAKAKLVIIPNSA